jgi:hypothetical protein
VASKGCGSVKWRRWLQKNFIQLEHSQDILRQENL